MSFTSLMISQTPVVFLDTLNAGVISFAPLFISDNIEASLKYYKKVKIIILILYLNITNL